MKAVGACGNRFVVSKERWARSVRPRLRQLPQSQFGCLAGSAWMPLRLERRGRICAPARLSVRSLQWGVAPSSASTGVRESHGTSIKRGEDRVLTASWFVGIDWASEAHEVCVLDRDGHVCERRQVRHTAPDLQTFVDALLARADGDPRAVAVGIEVPRGGLVDLFVER